MLQIYISPPASFICASTMRPNPYKVYKRSTLFQSVLGFVTLTWISKFAESVFILKKKHFSYATFVNICNQNFCILYFFVNANFPATFTCVGLGIELRSLMLQPVAVPVCHSCCHWVLISSLSLPAYICRFVDRRT